MWVIVGVIRMYPLPNYSVLKCVFLSLLKRLGGTGCIPFTTIKPTLECNDIILAEVWDLVKVAKCYRFIGLDYLVFDDIMPSYGIYTIPSRWKGMERNRAFCLVERARMCQTQCGSKTFSLSHCILPP